MRPDEVFNEERQRDSEQALDQLRPGDRALILLLPAEKKRWRRIAKITGLTPSNVKVKMHRILQKLMDRVKKNEKGLNDGTNEKKRPFE